MTAEKIAGTSAGHLWFKMQNLVEYSHMRGSNLEKAVKSMNTAQSKYLVRREIAVPHEAGRRHLLPVMLDTLEMIDQMTS